jgi:3-phytase
MRKLIWFAAVLVFGAAAVTDVKPSVETQPLALDVDDPAIWVKGRLLIGTVKRPKPDGALAVYSIEDGKLLETVGDLDRPNNVDILGDICVVTERLARQLRVYRLYADAPRLRLLGKVPVLEGLQGQAAAPMGVALYERKTDRALFAFVSPKTGPKESGYLWQYRLRISGSQVQSEKARTFGKFSGAGEIEAIAVDPVSERVYYSDEDCCVRVYPADPSRTDAQQEMATFAKTGFKANREGIAIAGKYVMVTDQLDPRSEYHLFDRETLREVAIWRGQAQSTDGLDATAADMGARYPRGFWVAMNNLRHNFQIYAF